MSETSQLTIQALAKQTLFTPTQRQKVEASINQLEYMLKDPVTKEASHVAPDTEMIEANLVRDKSMLQTGLPLDFTGTEKNRLNRLRQEIEKRLQYDMPTFDEMERPLPINVDKHMAWEKLHKQEIKAWKVICRTLDPLNDNVNFTSIARLRTNTPAKGDPRKYWQGFDAVDWDMSVEDAIADALDEDTYRGFLERRILGWSKVNIQKTMQMSDQLYAACLQKLKDSYSVAQTVAQEEDTTPRQPEIPASERNLRTALNLAAEDKRVLPWPLDELGRLGISLYRFCKIVNMPGPKMRTRIKNSTFSPQETQMLERALTRLRQEQQQKQATAPEVSTQSGNADAEDHEKDYEPALTEEE